MSICHFICPKRKRVRCLCALAFASAPYWLFIHSVLVNLLSVGELFVISFDRHHIQIKEITWFSYYFISFTVTWMAHSYCVFDAFNSSLVRIRNSSVRWHIPMLSPKIKVFIMRLKWLADGRDDSWASLCCPCLTVISRHRMTKGSPQVTWSQ